MTLLLAGARFRDGILVGVPGQATGRAGGGADGSLISPRHDGSEGTIPHVLTRALGRLRAALKTLSDLDQEPGGLFVRESKRWRKAGTGSRARRRDRRKRS